MKKSFLFTFAIAVTNLLGLGLACGPGPTQTKTKIAITGIVAHQKVLAGDTLLVAWTQSVANPKLSYNFNQGAGWQDFASVIPVNNNSVNAVLPTNSFTDSFQIKVEDNGGTFDPGITDPFSIKYIVITNPVAGQTLANGSTVAITWKYNPLKVNNLRFLLSTDGGRLFGDMLTSAVSPTQSSFSWVIGSEQGNGAPFSYPASNCILEIQQYDQPVYNDKTGTFSVQ